MEDVAALTWDWSRLHVCGDGRAEAQFHEVIWVYTRQRRLTASTFRRRRKSVWFEAVCGSPSCGFGDAHSSQRERASLEGDLSRLLLLLGHRRGWSVAAATKLRAHSCPVKRAVLWNVAGGTSTVPPRFPPHASLLHDQTLKGCFTTVASVFIPVSGLTRLIWVSRRLMFLSFILRRPIVMETRDIDPINYYANHWTFWICVSNYFYNAKEWVGGDCILFSSRFHTQCTVPVW